jgi:uncharacterized protein
LRIFLAANGIAALVYDKRGVAKSTGNWRTATFADLAGDVRAAVAALRQQRDVNPGLVGLWGLSQAGWIVPLVASNDAKVAFLVLVSTPALTPAQQEIDRVALVMKADGAASADVEAAGWYLRTFFDVVAGRQSWEALRTEMATTSGASWVRYVPRPQSKREVGWSPEPAELDPAPLLAQITVPVLALHGGNDLDIQAATNSMLYSKLSLNPASRQRVFERADHFMLVGVAEPDREYRHLSPGYLQTMIEWVKRVTR